MYPDKNSFTREAESVSRLSNVLVPHVVPLFERYPGKRPSLFGSGFLVSSGDSIFLVSAAHVLDAYRRLYFYTAPGTTAKLTGRLLRTKLPADGKRSSDRFDVGILKLEGVSPNSYEQGGKYALPLSALRSHAMPREDKQYLIIGFPASKSRANPAAHEIKSEPVSYRNISAPLSKYNDLLIRPDTHIVLNLDLERSLAQDGAICTFPSPSGLSGSPIWLLYDGVGPNDATQTPVVGVVTEYHKARKSIVATDIDIALRLINLAT